MFNLLNRLRNALRRITVTCMLLSNHKTIITDRVLAVYSCPTETKNVLDESENL